MYHFMLGPDFAAGCPACSAIADGFNGFATHLAHHDVMLWAVSRAPLAKLEAYKAAHGWDIKWYSSFGSDFNFDYHVSFDKAVAPIEYNYKDEAQLMEIWTSGKIPGELPGTSVFFRVGDDVFHTYSTFARGGEYLTNSSALLDITPYGRQEEHEDSPEGWPQR